MFPQQPAYGRLPGKCQAQQSWRFIIMMLKSRQLLWHCPLPYTTHIVLSGWQIYQLETAQLETAQLAAQPAAASAYCDLTVERHTLHCTLRPDP